MMHWLLSVFLFLFATGCGPRYVDYFPYYDDGTMKPHVVLLPVLDSSESNLSWSLSEEFVQGMRDEIMDNGRLYLLSGEEIGGNFKKYDRGDLFGLDLSFAQNLGNADFVVCSEVIEHRFLPSEADSTLSYPRNRVLRMKLRVRIIDVRRAEPHLVLQEIITKNCLVPEDGASLQVCWGGRGYPSSCYGLAHRELIQDFVKRIENVTWNAR